MAEITNRQVNVFIDTGAAQAALDVLRKKEMELKNALAQATDPKVVQKLTTELKKLEVPIENATKKLTGKLSPSIRDISRTVQALERDLKNLSREDPAFNRKLNQFRQAKTELEALRKEALSVNQTINSSGGFFGKVQSAGASLVGGLAQGFGIGLGVNALQQLPGLIQDSLDEFIQAEEATGRLENKLKNLGRSDAFDRISRKAQEMADKFKFLDNDDVIGVFDKLITYGKLTEKQMNELLPVIVNFAKDARISLEESTSVIIKALEGNGKALKEYGISIKDAGTLSERLGVVVNDLGKKVEGAAESFGESLPGEMAKAKQAFADFKENTGALLAPAFTFITNSLNFIVKSFDLLFESAGRGISGERILKQREDLEIIKNGFGLSDQQIKKLTSLSAENKQKIIDAERKRLAELKDNLAKARQGTDVEAELLLERNVALQERRLNAILDVVNANKILGTGEKNSGKDGAANNAKERIDEVAKLNEELRDLVASFDVKRLSEFQQKIEAIDRQFSKLEERAFKTNNGQLVNRIIQARENEIENAYSELLQSRAGSGPGAVDLTDPLVSIFDLVRGRTPGQAAQNPNQANDKEKKRISERLAEYVSYAESVTSIYGALSQALSNQADRELELERRKADEKKKILSDQLESNLISRKEYDRRVLLLDNDLAKKEKALRKQKFRRDQIEAGLRASINIAEAVTKMLTAGPLVGQILAGVAAAAGAVQLGLIAKSKFPEYGKGGRLGGPSHGEGGMPVINPRTGRKEAEVEGGEVILSKNTVRNNARLVNELLESSLYRNGEAISAIYGKGGRLPEINYGRASHSIQRATRFERGGTFGSAGAGSAMLEETLSDLNATLSGLQNQLNNGIVAYASIQQFNKQNDRLNAIIEDVTMK